MANKKFIFVQKFGGMSTTDQRLSLFPFCTIHAESKFLWRAIQAQFPYELKLLDLFAYAICKKVRKENKKKLCATSIQ